MKNFQKPLANHLFSEMEKFYEDEENCLNSMHSFTRRSIANLFSEFKALPHEELSTLGHFSEWMSNRIQIPIIIAKIPSFHFFAETMPVNPNTLEVSRQPINGAIVAPLDLWKQVQADKYHCLGGLVYVSSQSKDYYYNKFDDAVLLRAKASEAQYLLTLKEMRPDYELNAYQRGVLNEYPLGLESANIQSAIYEPDDSNTNKTPPNCSKIVSLIDILVKQFHKEFKK